VTPAATTPYRRPPHLRPGDHVRVIAPAGPIPADLLTTGTAILRSWDLHVTTAPTTLDTHPALGYLAGTDTDRAAALTEAWCDPTVDAILCARGGYGCLRILDLLDWDAIAAAPPKIFAGSSDVTAIHHAIGTRIGLATLFSPMIASTAFTADPIAAEALRRSLLRPDPPPPISTANAGNLVAGRARGTTFGGNASLLAALLGAPDTAPPPPGAILLLEDVTEDPYRLDRIITQLLRAGWFDDVAGIALGSWTSCGDLADVRAVMTDRLAGLGVPIGWELGFGHCQGQATIPLGVHAELDADAGTLTILEPALQAS
jgi:muramoyltetrapeptide carboxypeptidase